MERNGVMTDCNEQAAQQERGRSRFGRVYKRSGCTSCEDCNHDALGHQLAEVLKLKEPAAAAAPAANGTATSEVPYMTVSSKTQCGKADGTTRRSVRAAVVTKASEEQENVNAGKVDKPVSDATLVRAPLTKKITNKESGTVENTTMKKSKPTTKAYQEKKETKQTKEKKEIKQSKDGKENCPRVSSRKHRSLLELPSAQN